MALFDRLRRTLFLRSLGAMGIAGGLVIGAPALFWRGETHRRFRRVEAQLESELHNSYARCCGAPSDMEIRDRIIGVATRYQVTVRDLRVEHQILEPAHTVDRGMPQGVATYSFWGTLQKEHWGFTAETQLQGQVRVVFTESVESLR